MKVISILLFCILWTAVFAEIRLLSPFNKQEFAIPNKIKPKCKEHPAVHIDFKWTPVKAARSYVLVIEKQWITRRDDGFERIRYDPLIKSDEISSNTNRYFYDRGTYRWSVMGRNAKGDLDRESEQYYFSIV